MNTLQHKVKPYARAIVRLLKRDIDSNDKQWKAVLTYQVEISEYLNQIGLELIVNKEDGYAFLRQFYVDEEDNTIGLIPRRKIGFETSVIIVLLREIQEEFESSVETLANEKFISHLEIKEQAALLFQEKNNTVKFLRDIDRNITKTVELGYLQVVQDSDKIDQKKYKIKRIIKSKVTIDDLTSFKEKLKEYVESL